MATKVPPPDFAAFITEANHGRVNQALTERFGKVIVGTTDKAGEWGSEWKGEMTITIKVIADKYGGVETKFKSVIKIDDEALPGAKMYYNQDNGGLTIEEPRQVTIPGFENEKPRRVKSPDAPKPKADQEE